MDISKRQSKVELCGCEFDFVDQYDNFKLVQNCTVSRKNKIRKDRTKEPSHGEAKWYVGSSGHDLAFFGERGFSIKCFFLKKDLLDYLDSTKVEYEKPSQSYNNYFRESPEAWKNLWETRRHDVEKQDDFIWLNIYQNTKITHSGIYITSDDESFSLFRELCLPFISFVRMMKLKDSKGEICYYFKLTEDYDAILNSQKTPTLFTYGTKARKNKSSKKEKAIKPENKKARVGQGKYRDSLIDECHICPITKISDERILIASHIKPWAMSNEIEQVDPNNGFLLSPLFDKLFDYGFITFTDDKRVRCSMWISSRNWDLIGIKDKQLFESLPLNEERKKYLEFHRKYIFEKVRKRTFSIVEE